MGLKPPELGSRAGPLHLRVGEGEGGGLHFQGMRREGRPSNLASSQFWTLENVRGSGGKLVARGGQSKLNSSALGDGSTCVLGLFDEDTSGGPASGAPLLLGAGA